MAKLRQASMKNIGRRSVLVCVVVLTLSCRGDPTTVLTRLEASRRIAAELRVHMSQAVAASNHSVMADTDEGSIAAARQAEQATKAVTDSAAALGRLLDGLSYASEAAMLREFDARFSRYEELDRRILALAVENTNLKAQALSFGPASQAVLGFRRSLETIASASPSKERCHVDQLVADALRAVREIQVLHAPHIAEHDDAAMTRMEHEMADLDLEARAALKSLADSSPESAPAVAEAQAKLEHFKAITAQIVELSRRNTNVLALDLSLRQKPELAAACDDRIRALQEALANEGTSPSKGSH
jgi:hypothetical protein